MVKKIVERENYNQHFVVTKDTGTNLEQLEKQNWTLVRMIQSSSATPCSESIIFKDAEHITCEKIITASTDTTVLPKKPSRA